MSILQVVLKSLREMLWPRRFLPFFLLYFSLFTAAYALLLPLVNFAFNPPLTLTSLILLDIGLLIFIFIIGLLINLWFIAALIESVKSKRSFERSLIRVKKSYLQLITLTFVTIVLCFVASVFGAFKNLVRLILDWILFFSLPAIVLGRLSFERGIKKSFRIFKNKFLETVIFWLVNRFTLFIIFLISLFFLSLTITPLLSTVMTVKELENMTYTTGLRILGFLFSDNLFMLAIIIIGTLFLSFMIVFDYTSRTYYFLELTKPKRRRKR